MAQASLICGRYTALPINLHLGLHYLAADTRRVAVVHGHANGYHHSRLPQLRTLANQHLPLRKTRACFAFAPRLLSWKAASRPPRYDPLSERRREQATPSLQQPDQVGHRSRHALGMPRLAAGPAEAAVAEGRAEGLHHGRLLRRQLRGQEQRARTSTRCCSLSCAGKRTSMRTSRSPCMQHPTRND